MRKLVLILMMNLAFLAPSAFSGTGHDHGHSHGPITSEAVVVKAKEKISALVKSNKIPASWKQLEPESVQQKVYDQAPEWVVLFKNSQVKNIDKQSLYFFYSLDGHYIAANHSGT